MLEGIKIQLVERLAELLRTTIKPIWKKIRGGFVLSLLFILIYLAVQLAGSEIFVSDTAAFNIWGEWESFPVAVDFSEWASQKVVAVSAGTEAQKVKVSITGAVAKPGIYELSLGSVIADLIATAGGVTKVADTSYLARNLNLARQLQAQEQIYIPNKNEQVLLTQLADLNKGTQTVATSNGSNNNQSTVSTKVNINTASLEQLDTLPGIGQSTAQKIVAARPFSQIEDIKKVSGIGDATFEKIKDLIEV